MVTRQQILQAAAALDAGELVLVPTDTVYGIAVAARLDKAVERLYRAKNRDQGKPIPLLAADRLAAEEYGAVFNPLAGRLADRYWPGALTMVLPVRGGTEGIRVPDHELMLSLLREVGGLLRVTSANRSGEPEALTAGEALATLGDEIGFVLDAGPAPGGVPSTVVNVTSDTIRIVREGAIETSDLEEVENNCG